MSRPAVDRDSAAFAKCLTQHRGGAKRGTGILNNELYIGRLVWNRLRYVKNPDSGKRVADLYRHKVTTLAQVTCPQFPLRG